MVDVSLALTSANHVSKFAPEARLPYTIEYKVTAADMIAAKGSAIAAADVYDVLRVPAGTVILAVWAKKTAAFAGTSTDLTLDLGFTGGDVDVWVDGWDFDGATLGDYVPAAQQGVGDTLGVVTNAAQVVSLLVATQTGTWTGGEITFFALCLDIADHLDAGIVALGS